MRATLLAAAAVLVAGLVVAEASMQPSTQDRVTIYVVFGVVAVLTVLAGVVLARVIPRARSLGIAVLTIGLAAATATVVAVGTAAVSMFLSAHDLRLVLVSLGLGLGLGTVLMVSLWQPFAADMHRLSDAARGVSDGDLDVVTGVDRSDELGHLARTFDEMVERLAQAQEAREADSALRRDFLAAVGHDLRTPLASIQAAVEALQDGVAEDPDAYLRSIAGDVGALSSLVDDLFTLARVEAADLTLDRMEIDLAEVADEAMELMAPTAARHEVALRLDTNGSALVRADPRALGRVVRNLLENAIRHAPGGSTVLVRITRTREATTMEVIDRGPGFPDDFVARAFEPFARADTARSRDGGGSGLGLAIARRIVEAHDGHVRIESGPHGHLAFDLPRSPVPRTARHAKGTPDAGDGGRVRVSNP